MRIIAGEKKGFKLYTLPGEKVRPTTDFIKEAIFSVLFDCEGMKVLDLYSGSGSLGLEALSRGAESLDLVDISEKAVRVMRRNIDKLDFFDNAKAHRSKAETFVRANEKKYDLIFADPPYDRNMVNKTIAAIVENRSLNKDGLLIIEHSSAEKIDDKWMEHLYKQKKYGKTKVTFLTCG